MADLQRCCRILGIKDDAEPDEIRQAYRDLVRIWHPDRFSGDSRLQKKAQEQLKDINAAYRTLIEGSLSRRQTAVEPGNGSGTRPAIAFHRVYRRLFLLRRTGVYLLVLVCFGFLLASVRKDLAEIPYNLGSAYVESGHCDEALTALRIACWLNPDSDKIRYALGNAYYKSTLYAEAEKAYAEVILINPHHEGAQHRLAQLRAHRGTPEGAVIR